jgi:hypothetical protein
VTGRLELVVGEALVEALVRWEPRGRSFVTITVLLDGEDDKFDGGLVTDEGWVAVAPTLLERSTR